MDPTEWLRFKFLLITATGILLTFPAAAEAGPDLTCNVSQLPGGAFLYLLPKPPSSASCVTEWEDENKYLLSKYSIVFDQEVDQKLVQNLTDRSISLKLCLDYLHYKSDCLEGIEEAHCRVNCSSFSDKFTGNLTKNSTENSTLICFSQNWCLEKPYFGLFFAGIILLILFLIVGPCLYHKYDRFKCRRKCPATETTSYTAATKEVKIDLF